MNPMLFKDFYKVSHKNMYPKGTNLIYSNLTARKSRDGEKYIVFFGLQYFIKEYLINKFNKDFFELPREEAVGSYKRVMDCTLGKGVINVDHVVALHDLGYLPIKIKALPEGTKCPIGVPCLTIVNTKPEFFWLTNTLETIMSACLWGACTSATTANSYRTIFEYYAKKTCDNILHLKWQGHDFSFRGLWGLEATCLSGAAHLLSFAGSDNIPAGPFLEQYYNANMEKELILASVPASEHSTSSLGILDETSRMKEGTDKDLALENGEYGVIKRLITEVYPSGIISLVCDTFDFWKVITNILPKLKNEIMERHGKVVIRPDSSKKTPVEVICGDLDADTEIERKGLIEALWDLFGGTINSKGCKELDFHIGAIYGEAITLERGEKILQLLMDKGFASSNIVYGIGSMSYTLKTRDSLGFAVKATYGEINGRPVEIYKDPITDSGMKKSLKGLLIVYNDGTGIKVKDQCTKFEETEGLLETVFENGKLLKDQSLSEIRNRLWTT